MISNKMESIGSEDWKNKKKDEENTNYYII